MEIILLLFISKSLNYDEIDFQLVILINWEA